MYTAKCIIKDNIGNTIGAIVLDENNKEHIVRTSDILEFKNTGNKFQNTIIDSKGFIRAKNGKLPIIVAKNKKINAVENREIQQANKLIKTNIIKLYHGTKDDNLVPKYGIGKSNNDYGRGFYTTPDKELGKEWAYSDYTSGHKHYCYEFELDLTGLKILDLTKLDIMHWLAELVTYRKVDSDDFQAVNLRINQLIKKYKLNTSGYDIIIGYRADDKYFQYVKNFIGSLLTISQLEMAIRLGDLGLQVFIKSEQAFKRLKQTDRIVVPEKYKLMYDKRVDKATREFGILMKEARRTRNSSNLLDGTILDILGRDD